MSEIDDLKKRVTNLERAIGVLIASSQQLESDHPLVQALVAGEQLAFEFQILGKAITVSIGPPSNTNPKDRPS